MFIVTFRRRASRTWRNRLSTALRVIAPTQDETLSQRVERHLARITSSSWLGAAFQRYEITACIRWLHGPAAQRSAYRNDGAMRCLEELVPTLEYDFSWRASTTRITFGVTT
jgi:hypothetical protein